MIEKTFLLLFFSAFVFLSQAQNNSFSVELDWEETPRISKITDEHQQQILYFKDAVYAHDNPSLPIFQYQFRVNGFSRITASIVDEEFIDIIDNDIDLSDVPSKIALDANVRMARNQAMAGISFLPIRYNESTRRYEKLIRAKIIYELLPVEAASQTTRTFVTDSKLSEGTLYKISIQQTGVHKLDYNFLNSIGMNMDAIDPRNIQILGNGGVQLPENMQDSVPDDLVENAIFVSGQSDGRFDQGDYILFYGKGTKNWAYDPQSSCAAFYHTKNIYSDESYYYIKIADQTGSRISNNNYTASGIYTTSSYDVLSHHEIDELNLMEEEFALPPSGKEWYGESFRITRNRNFNFELPNRIITEPVKISTDMAVRVFSGGTASLTINNSNVSTINTPATTLALESQYAYRINFPCESSVINAPGINVGITLNHNSNAADMWLNYISIEARANLNYSGGQMMFRDSRSLGNLDAEYQFSSNSDVTIWDVTNHFSPQEMAQGTGVLNFGTTAAELHEFIAFDNNSIFTPQFVGAVQNQNLHAISAPPDVLIVTHSSLRTAADRLAIHRRNFDDLEVEVYEVDQIFNEFSSGIPDVTGIRNFVRMLYQRGISDEKVSHLLLLGVGTFDYKSIGRDPTLNPNLVPLYQSNESLNPVQTYTSDDYFSFMDSLETMNGNSLMDIAVGRIPAANLSEANIVVDKIIAYETDPSFLTDWKNRICFIADDEDGNKHINDAEGIANLTANMDSVYNINKIYLDAYQQLSTSGGERYPDAKKSLMDEIFRGTFVVNYLGHGSDDGWTQERIFTSNDINTMANKNKLPLLIAATCTFSPHDDPNLVSAGELLLLNPSGGAIALFTTLRLVYANDNSTLLNKTYQSLLSRKSDGSRFTTGEILKNAKNAAGILSYNSRKYIMLGDPSMKLSSPEYKIFTTKINDNIITGMDTISALDKVTIEGEMRDNNGQLVSDFNGYVYPTVFDKEDKYTTLGNDVGSIARDFFLRKKVIFKGKATVQNGRFSFEFIVPKDINYSFGNGKISYYAENATVNDASGYYMDFQVGGSNPNAESDETPPLVEVYMNNEDFVSGGLTNKDPLLLIKLSDDSGINTVGNSIGHDLTAQITSPSQDIEQVILNEYYESAVDDYTSGTVRYQLNDLNIGLHSIKVTAWDVYNNKGEGFTEFVVAEDAVMALDHIFNYPNPFSTNTNFQFEHNQPFQDLDVQIQIYTVSGKLIKTIDHFVPGTTNEGYRVSDIHWDGKDESGDRLANGVYVYKVQVRSMNNDQESTHNSAFQKLVILK